MWPFTKLYKRIDQLQKELADVKLRLKELEKPNEKTTDNSFTSNKDHTIKSGYAVVNLSTLTGEPLEKYIKG